jgi:two-component system, chemotaxis family, sensor kinase CheA
MDKTQAKAAKEFAAEAEELLEALAEDLDAGRGQFESSGKVRPDRLNKIFREMHSLKGLASMLALERITQLSHDLESLLDKIRMGKVKMAAGHFTLLSDCLRTLRILVKEAGQGEERTEIGGLLERIARSESSPDHEEAGNLFSRVNIDQATLASFTEYEEHRLKENLEEGNHIYAVQVGFDYADFDTRLRALSEKLTELGEIISTLPVVDPALTDGIHFRLLVGLPGSSSDVEAAVQEVNGTLLDLTLGGAPAPAAPPVEVAATEAPAAPAEEPPPPAEAEEAQALEEIQGISNTVKVDIEKLDAVMGIVGELNLVRTSLWKVTNDLQGVEEAEESAIAISKQVRIMEKKLGDLQRAIVDIRMVPIGQIFARINRTAKKLARGAGKDVNVHLYGGETELDKIMIDQLVTPLVHLIRNSIDHGLETPTDRVKHGKNAEGNLAISAYQKGNSIVIEVTDDGRGIQYEKIRQAAVRKGLVSEQATLTPEECMELIFQPGFSSADQVTEVSGRGVGLDAVKSSIEAMKGSIGLWSEPGQGTPFQTPPPLPLAIIQSLLVSCAGHQYAIPISSVLETLRIMEKQIQLVDRREVFDLRGVTLPLLRLDERFGLSQRERNPADRIFVVVARRGDKAAGIIVGDLLGEQETVVHPIGQRFSKIPGIAGATEVGENQVILVIDTASLFSTMETVRM